MNAENGGLDTPNNETAFNSQFENGALFQMLFPEINQPLLDEKPTSKRSSIRIPAKRKKRIKESIEAKRERKAWRTLAIITGTFVACWTPFFLLSLYRPICGCQIPPVLESITSWLGYMNSALNPIIYTGERFNFELNIWLERGSRICNFFKNSNFCRISTNLQLLFKN